MPASKLIFWDVDTQVDFIHPGGKLYVPGAEHIVPNLRRLSEWARQKGVTVVASMCAHRPGDPEFETYGQHCLVGTPGQQKIPETQLPRQFVIPYRAVALPPRLEPYDQVILEKEKLDVFTNPNTEKLLEKLGRSREVVLYGVVTEICVACAARGLQERGYKLTLVSDAVRHLDEQKGRELSDEVLARGGRLAATDEVLRELESRRVA